MKKHNGMRPHDIVVLLKISLMDENWFYKDLAKGLFISASEITESLNRSKLAGLITSSKKNVQIDNLLNFISNGLEYVFPVQPGSKVRGVPTAHSAPVIKNKLISDEVYVWPSRSGSERGQAIQPLYDNLIKAVEQDSKLYETLALVEMIRVGRVREKNLAIDELSQILRNKYAHKHNQIKVNS